jgi:glycosyltransferase involved in cell wall biosynthesis
MINYACVTLGASIAGHSLQCPPPADFTSAITPVLNPAQADDHYAAADRPLPEGEHDDWFVIDLGRERLIHELEIEWYAACEAGIDFTLERQQHAAWSVCLGETAGNRMARGRSYRRALDQPVAGRYFKFRLRKAQGQNRLLIRRFALLGPGVLPRRILMLAPDCYMIDRRILQEARSLIGRGYRVTLLSGFECAEEQHYVADGIEIHRYTYDWDDERLKKIRARLPRNERLIRWVNQLFMQVAKRVLPQSPFDAFVTARARQFPSDVVHVHDLPCLQYGVSLSREWGVPLVFDTHEIYPEQESLSPRQQYQLRRQERRFLPHTQLFVTINEAVADWYQDHYGRRPLVLMNCADPLDAECMDAGRERLQTAANLPASCRVVLYQGWMSAERNLDTLVRVTAQLPEDTYLVLIGYGAYEPVLQALCADQPWHDRVRFLGRIEPDDILMFTAGADVGMIPYLPIDLNHRLCSPNKFFEYLQVGVPVVAHDLPFFREMAQTHGVVTVGDLSTVEGMGEVLNALLADDARLQKMRDACRKASLTLTWEVEVQKLLDAYVQVVAPDAMGEPDGPEIA